MDFSNKKLIGLWSLQGKTVEELANEIFKDVNDFYKEEEKNNKIEESQDIDKNLNKV